MSKTLTAKQIFKKQHPNKNGLTPHIIKYGKIHKNLVYEFSWGEGWFGEISVFGLSFVELLNNGETKSRNDLTKAFPHSYEAESYIDQLKIKARWEN